MNKIKTFLLSLLAVILGAFCLVSCGEKGIEGTYKFSYLSTTIDEEAVIAYPGDEYRGEILPENLITVKLESEGKMQISLIISLGSDKQMSRTGTWEKGEEDTVILTVDGSPQEVTVKDGMMEFYFEGMGILVLEKD